MRHARFLFPLLAALACAPAAADFQDRGMRDGRLRTDLPPGRGSGSDFLRLEYRPPLGDGCQFSINDPLNAAFGCPGLNSVDNRLDGTPGWRGLQLNATCGTNDTAVGKAQTDIGFSWLGCVSYAGSPYFALNDPGSQYWVAVANSEPAFDQCNDGPPGVSHSIRDPISNPGPSLYKVAMETLASGARRAHLIVNATNHPFRCDRPGYKQGPHSVLPFLSLGAHAGHGQAGPVATMNRNLPADSRQRVKWTSWTLDYTPFGCDPAKGSELCFAKGVHAGFYGIASWDGVKRLVFVNTISTDDLNYDDSPPSKTHWNWPVQESFYYPGAEIAMLSSVQLLGNCGIEMPRQPLEVGNQQYSVDITAIFACASDLKLFTSQMPRFSDIDLDGFHWYMESVGTRGALWLSVEDPRVD